MRSYGGSGSRETTRTEPSAPSSRSVRAAEKPGVAAADDQEVDYAQTPLNSALRFSANARKPSAASAVSNSRAMPSRSRARRVGDRHLDARVGGELDLADRGGGAAGQRLRVLARLLRRLRRGEQAVEDAERRAPRRARSARPVIIRSSALRHADDARQALRAAVAGQQARASPPARRACTSPRAPKRRSHASVISRPPPSAWPSIWAMKTFGMPGDRGQHLVPALDHRHVARPCRWP